jgi:predicted Zn finger-like uncharacterized protein
MIIQCRQCSAKFRFDDVLMRPEGVWLRCSLCQCEFYQSHPLALPEDFSDRIPATDVEETPLDHKVETPDEPQETIFPPAPDMNGNGPEDAALEDAAPKDAATGIRIHSNILKLFAFILMLLLVLAGVVYVVAPELGGHWVREWSQQLPWMEKIEKPQPASITDSIRIENVNQRYVSNPGVGNMRVIEGVAVNASVHPLARLQIKATLVDAQNNVIGEKRVTAGNMMTDGDLSVMTAEEINRRLSVPEGGAASGDRILPGDGVPFMIVWVSEPPGAANAYVTVVDAERPPQ